MVLTLSVICLLCISTRSWSAEVSVGEAVVLESELATDSPQPPLAALPVFGSNLFQGNFSQKAQAYFNPDYKVAIGDTINLKIWGAFELELDARVDAQGNVFIPKLGTVAVAGLANKDLVKVIKAKVNQSYNQKIFVYANVASY
jgi:protein involved in polysaccharide export with SLBB domain